LQEIGSSYEPEVYEPPTLKARWGS
jgi:hypothetical protein